MPRESARGALVRTPREVLAARERTDQRIVAVEPAAFDARGAAQYLGISRAHLMRLVSSGRAPAGVKLGTRRIFPRATLAAWLEAGALPVVRWQVLQRETGSR